MPRVCTLVIFIMIALVAICLIIYYHFHNIFYFLHSATDSNGYLQEIHLDDVNSGTSSDAENSDSEP